MTKEDLIKMTLSTLSDLDPKTLDFIGRSLDTFHKLGYSLGHEVGYRAGTVDTTKAAIDTFNAVAQHEDPTKRICSSCGYEYDRGRCACFL